MVTPASGVSPGGRFFLIFVFVCGALASLVGAAVLLVPDLPWFVPVSGALCAVVAGVAGGLVDLLGKLKRDEDRNPAAPSRQAAAASAPWTASPYAHHQVTVSNHHAVPTKPGVRTNWIIATVVTAVFSLFYWFLFPIPIITGLVAARRTKAAWLVALITLVTIVGCTLLLIILAVLSTAMSS